MTASASFSLLNTRPAHQAEVLSQSVRSVGGQVFNCPTLEIEWLLTKDSSIDLPHIHKVIFTSVNAVNGFIRDSEQSGCSRLASLNLSQIHCYAIGKATQQSGLEAGLPLEVLSETHFDSESLLKNPVMQAVAGETILIVKGQGGRPLLIETLRQRDAEVITLDVYQRVAAPLCEEAWLQFINSHYPVLLITSVESFESLTGTLANYNQAYMNLRSSAWQFLQQSIVFSQRIKSHMLEKGWTGPIQVVSEQSNTGVLASIKQTLLSTSSELTLQNLDQDRTDSK